MFNDIATVAILNEFENKPPLQPVLTHNRRYLGIQHNIVATAMRQFTRLYFTQLRTKMVQTLSLKRVAQCFYQQPLQ